MEFLGHPGIAPGEFRGIVKRVIDGDTIDVLVDLGFYSYAFVTVRLAGMNAPEPNRGSQEQRALGIEAKIFAEERVLDQPVVLHTWKDRTTFGRFVASVQYWDAEGKPRSLCGELVRAGLAEWGKW